MQVSHQKLVRLGFLVCGVVAWIVGRQIAESVWGWFNLPVPADWVVMPTDLVGVLLGLTVFVLLLRSKKANSFTQEAVSELAKVTWPPRKETALSTIVIAIMIVIATLAVLVFDVIWGTLVRVAL